MQNTNGMDIFKIYEIEEKLWFRAYAVICISEIYIVLDRIRFMLKKKGYTFIYDLQQNNIKRRGAGIAVKNSLKPVQVGMNDDPEHQHAMALLNCASGDEIIICSAYIPGTPLHASKHYKLCEALVSVAKSFPRASIICAYDANLPQMIFQKLPSLDYVIDENKTSVQIRVSASLISAAHELLGNCQWAPAHTQKGTWLDFFMAPAHMVEHMKDVEKLVTTGDIRHHENTVFKVVSTKPPNQLVSVLTAFKIIKLICNNLCQIF